MREFVYLLIEIGALTSAGFTLSCPWPYWLVGLSLIALGLVCLFASRAPLLDDFDQEPAAPIEAQRRTIGRRP